RLLFLQLPQGGEEALLVAEGVHDLSVLEAGLPGHRRQSEAASLLAHAAGCVQREASGVLFGQATPSLKVVVGPESRGGTAPDALVDLLKVAKRLQRKLVDAPHPRLHGGQVLLDPL